MEERKPMGASTTLEAQRATYWQMLKLTQKLRGMLGSLAAESYPPRIDSSAKQTKQKIDQLFRRHRTLVADFRRLSYELRAMGEQDCENFLRHSLYGDPSEIFPSWASIYRGPNYSFGGLSSDGRQIYPAEGQNFGGFWQLLRNLIPSGDDRLELWPEYFGQSSTGDWELKSQIDVLSELRFPLSGANLEGAIAVDLETSSLTPLAGEILEIGIVELIGNDPLKWPRFSLRFDLSSDLARSLGTGSKHIHGIAVEDLAGSPQITDPDVQKLLRHYLCSGRRLITHNASFEFRWLSHYVDGFFEANYDQTGLQTSIDTGVFCKFAFSLAGGRGIEGNSLRATVETLKLEYREAHRAQSDAAMAALAALGMLALAGGRSMPELSDDQYGELLLKPFA